MYDTILVPVDASDTSEYAADRALDLARTFEASVHLLAVVDTGHAPVGFDREGRVDVRRPSERAGRRATARVDERADERGLTATRIVREGTPYREILAYADEHDVDLIVMGTHGLTGPERVRLGSTAERVVTRAETPVMTIPLPDDAGDVTAYDRVVIATDGSDVAERAADRGFELADGYGSDVYVTYVIDAATYDLGDAPRSILGMLKEGGRNAVEEIAAVGRERGLSVETDVLRGRPDEEIRAYADGIGADLVVMGARGRRGAESAFLGSTAARVLRRSTRPTLTVG